MEYNLRKYSYAKATPATKPDAADPSKSPTQGESHTSPADTMAESADSADMKAEILSSLKKDIAALIRSELTAVMTKEFDSVRSELNLLKTEVAKNTATLRSDVETVKTTVAGMEGALTMCSDDMVVAQTKISKLETTVASLQSKCVDLEGRMRRDNIRISGVAETAGSSSPAAVSKLLRDVLNLDRDVLIDRSHRGLKARGDTGGNPRVIVAKLHYHQDRVLVMKRAREAAAPLRFNGKVIYINEDFPQSVLTARLKYKDVKRFIRDRGIKDYGLIYPSRFFIKHNGTERQFQNADEAMAYARDNIRGRSPPPPPPPRRPPPTPSTTHGSEGNVGVQQEQQQHGDHAATEAAAW